MQLEKTFKKRNMPSKASLRYLICRKQAKLPLKAVPFLSGGEKKSTQKTGSQIALWPQVSHLTFPKIQFLRLKKLKLVIPHKVPIRIHEGTW